MSGAMLPNRCEMVQTQPPFALSTPRWPCACPADSRQSSPTIALACRSASCLHRVHLIKCEQHTERQQAQPREHFVASTYPTTAPRNIISTHQLHP